MGKQPRYAQNRIRFKTFCRLVAQIEEQAVNEVDILGIDLGTTNSAIAIWKLDKLNG
jgi:hypothetical protein